jgi:nucleotide-binding universal stress UspA family protein
VVLDDWLEGGGRVPQHSRGDRWIAFGAQSGRQAVDLARAQNSTLTLMSVAPPVSTYVTLGGVSSEAMAAELEKWADRTVAEAAASLPEDVNGHTLQRSGHVGEEIVKELARGRYDLVVLGSRGRGPAREGLFGSVNGYVHFHSRVPVLSVPDDEP